MADAAYTLSWLLGDIGRFSRSVWPDKALRGYQLPAARSVVASVIAGDGTSSVWVFSRQSGKDEALAQVLAFLLILYQYRGGEIVVALPSLIPQGQISMRRLADRLHDARAFLGGGVVQAGEVIIVGKASVRFMSAGPNASARGATASLLLVANEAQDIEPDKWDAVFDPMGASTNAPTLFMGTVWTDTTLLARAMGTVSKRRLFRVPWRRVAEDVAAYGARVRQRIAELGENHPFIRTEYELLPLEGGGLLFGSDVQGKMRGSHVRLHKGEPGRVYALLLDVAGGAFEEGGERPADGSEHRDSTVLTVVEVGRPAGAGLPAYRVVDRCVWLGVNHLQLAAEVSDLARSVWRASAVIVDATGIGHGLAGLLVAALGERVVQPFVFSSSSKSALGYAWLGQIGAGRYQEYADDGAADTRLFWRQVGACAYEIRTGPGRLMSWSVPDAEMHDDLLLSAALCGALDERDWRPRVAVGR